MPVLTGVETRTSSPLRIRRDDDDYQSINVKGLYPAGEGPGMPAGSTPRRIDGIEVAEAVATSICAGLRLTGARRDRGTWPRPRRPRVHWQSRLSTDSRPSGASQSSISPAQNTPGIGVQHQAGRSSPRNATPPARADDLVERPRAHAVATAGALMAAARAAASCIAPSTAPSYSRPALTPVIARACFAGGSTPSASRAGLPIAAATFAALRAGRQIQPDRRRCPCALDQIADRRGQRIDQAAFDAGRADHELPWRCRRRAIRPGDRHRHRLDRFARMPRAKYLAPRDIESAVGRPQWRHCRPRARPVSAPRRHPSRDAPNCRRPAPAPPPARTRRAPRFAGRRSAAHAGPASGPAKPSQRWRV